MNDKMRAWWFERQGLSGMSGTPADVLERSGWARSVGGCNPYLTFFSRAGIGLEQADAAAKELEIQELPSARGCTYVVPASDYALALKVGQGTSEVAALSTAKKWLGFTDKDLEILADSILNALQEGPLDPKGLKDRLGDVVVNFGEEGKKRGQTTSLSLGLGWLQAHGHIRRIPNGGRLDSQSYSYSLWSPNPLDGFSATREEALTQLAEKYFRWIGPAKASHFQWFSGLGVAAAKAAIAPLDLVEIGDGYLLLREDEERCESFSQPSEPCYALVSGLDAIALLQREAIALFDESDRSRTIVGEKGRTAIGAQDLTANAILDRGRVVGLWEYDPEAAEIAAMLFIEANTALTNAMERTADFIRKDLGDARSFSLDSPASRRPKIEAIRLG